METIYIGGEIMECPFCESGTLEQTNIIKEGYLVFSIMAEPVPMNRLVCDKCKREAFVKCETLTEIIQHQN